MCTKYNKEKKRPVGGDQASQECTYSNDKDVENSEKYKKKIKWNTGKRIRKI